MSRRFKLSTGEIADVEDEDLDEFMGDMERAGETVSLADDEQPQSPAPDMGPSPQPSEEQGVLQRLLGFVFPEDERAAAQQRQRADVAAASQQFSDTYSSPQRTAATLLGNTAAPLTAAGRGVLGMAASAAQSATDAYAGGADPGMAAILSAATDTALGAAGKVGGGAANMFRRRQLGLSQGQYQDLARDQGLDAARNVGELPDAIGATNTFWPQSSADMSQRAGEIKRGFGAQEGRALDAAAGEVEPGLVSKDATYERLRQLQGQSASDPSSAGAGLETQYGGLANRLAGAPNPQTPRDLLNLKRQYEASAGYGASDAVSSQSDALSKVANRNAATATRQDLDQVMQTANPETYNDFNTGREGFGQAALVENAARDKAAGDLAGQNGQQQSVLDQLVRGAGLPQALDLGASFGGNVGRMAEGAGRNSGAVSSQVGMGMGNINQQDGRRRATEDSRGDRLGAVTAETLQRDPQSLGPYADELRQAEEDGTLHGVLTKLVQSDEEFRTQYYPQLLQRTAR